MERPTRRLDLPAFPRSRPRHPGQLALSRLRRMGRLQLLALLLQLVCLALLLKVAGQVEPSPRHRWSGGFEAQSGSAPSPRIAR